jgi:RNA polymerase sigma-70 factor (ECF subfamily)
VVGVKNEDESEIIAEAKRNPEAFGVIYERYVSQIYRYIYYRTGNKQDAEDLTARTFYRALEKLAYYEDRGAPFTAWLYRIAHNLVANWLRDRGRHPEVALDSVVLSGGKRQDPHAEAVTTEEREILMERVRRLAPDRQQLLVLKFIEEMTNREIGEVMGRTEGAIKSLYHRTLVALREEYGEEG